MKSKTHPLYYSDAKVTCGCGNTFTVGSVLKEIKIEFCSKCHPAFTGVKKFIDTTRRIEKFKEKLSRIQKMKKNN